MNKEIMISAGFGEEVNLIEKKQCPFCRTQIKIDEFKDTLSLKEYTISGLCQKCQDKTFG